MSHPIDAEGTESTPRPAQQTPSTLGGALETPTRKARGPRRPQWEERQTDARAGVKIALAFLVPLLLLMVWAFATGG